MGMKPRQPIALTLDECEPITDADLYDDPPGTTSAMSIPEPEGPTEIYERGFADGERKAMEATSGDVVLDADEVEALIAWTCAKTTGFGPAFDDAMQVARDVAMAKGYQEVTIKPSAPPTIAAMLKDPACSPLEFSVLRFAEAMLRKLRANEDKPGWEGDTLGQLSARVTDEWLEARQAMSTFTASVGLDDDLTTLSLECSAAVDELADVGNFCMMLAERLQALYKKAAQEQSRQQSPEA